MKHVLIVENSTDKLKINENNKGNKFLLSGIFTEFDVENRNKRFYTAENFIPCMNAMLEKKDMLGVLFGEFDHPDVFDIAGKNISHAIEDMQYNESANRVEGSIALLSTRYGKEARAIISDGYPLFVSSRAAGVTEGNGNVMLKELFTYDTVVDPGFASTRMSVNESFGFKEDHTVPYRIYEMNDNNVETLFQDRKNDQKVAIDMNAMRDILNDEVVKLEAKIMESVKSKNTSPEEVVNLQEKYNAVHEDLTAVNGYLKYLESKVQHLVKTNKELSNELNETVTYSNHLFNNVKKIKSTYDKIEERLTVSEKMVEHVAEHSKANILFTKDIASNVINMNEDLNLNTNLTEYLAEELKASNAFLEYIAEENNVTQMFAENIAKETNITQKFTEHNTKSIKEKINDVSGFAEYTANESNNNEVLLAYIAEKVDGIIDYEQKVLEKLKNTTPVNENKNEDSIHNLESITEHLGLDKEKELASKLTKEDYHEDDFEEETEENIEDISTEEVEDTNTDLDNFDSETEEGSLEDEEGVDVVTDEDITDEDETEDSEETLNDDINLETEDGIETTVETELLSALVKILGSDETGIVIEVTPEGQVKVQKSGTEEIEEYTTEQIKVLDTENNIAETVNNVLAEIKKQKVLANSEPHFFTFLSEKQVADFKALEQDTKDAIMLAMNESEYYSDNDVLSIIGNVLNEKSMNYEERLVKALPKDLKEPWNEMTKEQKMSVITESKYFSLTTTSDIKNFWNTRPFAKALKSPEATMVKESLKANDDLENDTLSNEFEQAFLDAFNKI